MAYYRIVRDTYRGYEVQRWLWYFPFWHQPSTNTHGTIQEAEDWARSHARLRNVVKYLGTMK